MYSRRERLWFSIMHGKSSKTRLVISVSAAVAVGALVTITAPASAQAAEPYPGCRTVVPYDHRGDQTSGFTENSSRALDLAGDNGDGFETDLRTTLDGSVILMHDRTIARTTTGTGRVARMTIAEIRAHRLNDGSKVPSLGGALTVLVNHPGRKALLELKPGAMPAKSLRMLRQAILDRGLRNRVTVISFDRRQLLEMRKIAPGFETSLLANGDETDWKPRRFAQFGGASLPLEQRTDKWIRRAHDLGLALIESAGPEPGSWTAATDAAATGVIIDAPNAYNTWCGG